MKTEKHEKTQRSVVPRVAEPSPPQQATTMPLHGLVVPTPARKQASRPKRAPRRMPRISEKRAARETERLKTRVLKLLALGFRNTQVAPIVGLSHTGLYRAFVSKTMGLRPTKLVEYHKNIDAWVKRAGSI